MFNTALQAAARESKLQLFEMLQPAAAKLQPASPEMIAARRIDNVFNKN
jgi:hypothetical protein